jgi:LPS export ABC transporter protein LptC
MVRDHQQPVCRSRPGRSRGAPGEPVAVRIAFTLIPRPNIIQEKIDQFGMKNESAKRSSGRSRWLWVLGLAFCLGVGAWGLWGHRPPPPKPAAPVQNPRMEGLSLTEIHEGDKTWILEAKKADFHPDLTTVEISGVRVEFFGPGQDIRVKADEGLFNTKTRVLTLKGQVEMKSGDLTVQTSVATYLPAERALLAPENVVISEPGLKVEGKGMRVELAAKKLVMTQHRLTEVQVQDWRAKP